MPFYTPRKLLEIPSITNCKLGGQKLLSPDSAAFQNITALPFLAGAYSALARQAAAMVQFHRQAPEREPANQQDTKHALPRTSTSSRLQKWKTNGYTFFFHTLEVSFSSKTTALFACQGFFSAVNKNVDSEALAKANRKMHVSMHYQKPGKAANTYHLPESPLWVYIIYTLNYALVTFWSRICFCSLISKRDFKAIKFYWCKCLSIQCIFLGYLQMFFLLMNHLVSRNLFEQVFLEN